MSRTKLLRRYRPSRAARLLALVAAVLVVPFAGCGSEGGDEAATPAVAATSGILADLVGAVGGGDVSVTQLVPDGASPHNYALSAREQQELSEADLLVYTSPALEQSLPLDGADRSFALAEHTGPPRSLPGEEGVDPHVWLDPTRIREALPALAAALTEIDPGHAVAYERRAQAYERELGRLDRELAATIATIPAGDRKLVTSHDLLGYYADRYGLDVVGAPFGVSPEAEASAGELAELIERVEREQVPAVFAQQGDDPEVLRTLADEAGVQVVDDLLLESLGPGGESYPEMLRFSTARIAAALGGAETGG